MSTIVISRVATEATSNIKDCMSTLIGYLIFKDVVYQLVNVCGVVLTHVGGIVFSYAKLKEFGEFGRGSEFQMNEVALEETCNVESPIRNHSDSEQDKLLAVSLLSCSVLD